MARKPDWLPWTRWHTIRDWRAPTWWHRCVPPYCGAPDDEATRSPGIERRWRPTVPSRAATTCAGASPSAADSRSAASVAPYAQLAVEILGAACPTRQLAAGGSRDDAGRHQQHIGQRQGGAARYPRPGGSDHPLQNNP